MRKILLLILISTVAIAQNNVEIISFNIRYATPNDGINQWENRKDKVVSLLNFHSPDVFGLQEALKSQIDYIAQEMPNYTWIGVGRDDGKAKGEYSPIFYNSKKLELITSGTFWLAAKTDKPIKGWDAALPRIATYARFKGENKTFLVLNTHYDHIGEKARRNSSLLILDQLKLLQKAGEPVVFMGDFNASPQDEPIKVFLSANWKQARIASPALHLGPVGTFNGFKEKESENEIDHIFFNDQFEIVKSATLSNTWGGLFASDHHGVYANLRFKE